MNQEKELINADIKDLKEQIQQLGQQNAKIQSLVDKQKERECKLLKLLQARRPFYRTYTGEVIFPGKKEMEWKLDVMTNEILKLRKVLDDFKKDRCRISLAEEIYKSINPKCDNDIEKKKIIDELDKQYCDMIKEFDDNVLQISKYRVELDLAKKELDKNEKRLKENQNCLNTICAKLNKLESNNCKNNKVNLKEELANTKERLDSLSSIVKYYMDELNAKNKEYMDAIQEKEYHIVRANDLCEEKSRLTTEFEVEFNRMKEYFEKRRQHVDDMPAVLCAVQEQISIQAELKSCAEETIEILNEKLKKITVDPCGDFMNKSKVLEKLKTQNINLKTEQNKMENILADIQCRYSNTKQNIDKLKCRPLEIKNETISKIEEIRKILKGPTEEYLSIIEKLQNQISKIEAYSCYEDGKFELVSSTMENQMNALTQILKDAQEKTTEIKNIQEFLITNHTTISICNDESYTC